MGEETKVYCMDRPNNDGLLTALAMKDNDRNDLATAMAANGGMNNWMNNPFAYMMFMSMFGANGWGANGWGRNGAGAALAGADTALGATTLAQTQNLATQMQNMQNQMQDNHNSDVINGNIAGVKSQLGDMNVGMIGGFANLGQDVNGVKSAVIEQGYQNQLANCGQTNTILMQSQALQNAVQNGFTQLGFQIERNACDVKETSTANTQKIVDVLNNKWNQDASAKITQLQDEITTMKQTQALVAALGSGSAAVKTTAAA